MAQEQHKPRPDVKDTPFRHLYPADHITSNLLPPHTAYDIPQHLIQTPEEKVLAGLAGKVFSATDFAEYIQVSGRRLVEMQRNRELVILGVHDTLFYPFSQLDTGLPEFGDVPKVVDGLALLMEQIRAANPGGDRNAVALEVYQPRPGFKGLSYMDVLQRGNSGRFLTSLALQ